jgi:hypothetical protein
LLLALLLPYAAVSFGLLVLRSVEAAFLFYAIGGCLLGPCLLLGLQPLRAGSGYPWLPPPGRRRAAAWEAALLWAVCGPGLAAAYLALGPRMGNPQAYYQKLIALGWHGERFVVYAALFLALIPWLEEWWWRGQAVPRCVQAFGPKRGLALAAAAFAGYHAIVLSRLYPAGPVAIRMAAILLASWWWCAAARRHRCWSIPWLAHGPGADLAVALLFVWLHRAQLGEHP